jgi:hypothetical protein
MSTLRVPTLLATTLALAATAGHPAPASASIAMDMCMSSGQSYLGLRLGRATDVVQVRPTTLTYRDHGETRTMTATYEVLAVAKGSHAKGDVITVQKDCGRRQQWYERRGYPSSFCGDGANGAMPGFAGATPTSSGTLLLDGAGLVGGDNDTGYGACPSFDPVAAGAADPVVAASLALLAAAPELAAGKPLPFRPLRPRRDP